MLAPATSMQQRTAMYNGNALKIGEHPITPFGP